jgi:hypothetical protein
LIDLEKAYDSVWRKGLMLKLHEQGVRGKAWRWIGDFLQNREAYNALHGWHSERYTTEVGLPQGRVISPLLFYLFVRDIYNKTTGRRVKFADDGKIWHTGEIIEELSMALEEDLGTVVEWARKWRMIVNTNKTEVCLFGKRMPTNLAKPKIRMGTAELPYNPTPCSLGVHLDEELNFSRHIEKVEQKANKVLSLLRTVKETEKITSARMLQFYKALVIPHLEYASPVWQNSIHCSKLDGLQRKGLAICISGLKTGGRAALEVELNIIPLELRREELAVREIGKVIATENVDLLKLS